MIQQYDLYSGIPPHRKVDTSIEASKSILPVVNHLAQKAYDYIAAQSEGATCWETAEALGMLHQTASARCRELQLRNMIVDSGKRRKTGTGRNARVYIPTKERG